MKRIECFIILILLLAGYIYAQQILITGIVTAAGQPLSGATLSLAEQNITVQSAADGSYKLEGDVVIANGSGKTSLMTPPVLKGGVLSFTLLHTTQYVRIALYDLRGRCIATPVDKILPSGSYTIPFSNVIRSSQVYCLVLQVNRKNMVVKKMVISGNRFAKGVSNTLIALQPVAENTRNSSVSDTIIVSKMGYKTVKKAIDAYTGTHDFNMIASSFTITGHTIDVTAAPSDITDGVGWGDAPHPQIIIKLWQDSCFAIAWNDKNDAVHITKVSSDYQVYGTDILFINTTLAGFTVTPAGFGLTAVRDSMLSVISLDSSGTIQFEKLLIGDQPHIEYQAKFDPMAFGSSRLHFADNTFASYFAHQQQFSQNPDSSEVHQGDMLVFLDADGNELSGGWNWGTSHSLDERIDHDGEAFVTVSLGDAYPKGITFQRVGEISKKTIMQLDANMGGWANGDLGGLVILDEGYVVAFCSPQGRDTTDAGFMCVDANGAVLRTVWLTENKKGTLKKLNRVNAAQYGDSLVFISWNMYNNSTKADTAYAVAVTFEGTVIIGPDRISDTFNIGDDFITMPNGDVVWAIAQNGELKILRVSSGG